MHAPGLISDSDIRVLHGQPLRGHRTGYFPVLDGTEERFFFFLGGGPQCRALNSSHRDSGCTAKLYHYIDVVTLCHYVVRLVVCYADLSLATLLLGLRVRI